MPIWSLSRAELDVLEDLEYAIEKGNAYLLRNMLTLKDLTGARSFVAYSGIESPWVSRSERKRDGVRAKLYGKPSIGMRAIPRGWGIQRPLGRAGSDPGVVCLLVSYGR